MVTLVDLEKQNQLHQTQIDDDSAATPSDRDPAPPENPSESDEKIHAIRESNAIIRFLVRVEKRIGGQTNFEAMGVERIPEDKRTPPQKLNVNDPIFVSHPRLSGQAGEVVGFLPWELYLTVE